MRRRVISSINKRKRMETLQEGEPKDVIAATEEVKNSALILLAETGLRFESKRTKRLANSAHPIVEQRDFGSEI